jgi:hypothetical protein
MHFKSQNAKLDHWKVESNIGILKKELIDWESFSLQLNYSWTIWKEEGAIHSGQSQCYTHLLLVM